MPPATNKIETVLHHPPLDKDFVRMPLCALCRRKDDEPNEYGGFMKKSGITVHYYCLLLSTNLPQNGTDGTGILGFRIMDIRKEISICAKRECRYCNKLHATTACHDCKRYYHIICGNENGCASIFVNDFRSYCHEHVPFKDEAQLPGMPSECWICKETLGTFNPIRILRSYCCNNGYVHRSCMRSYALSAGYYLRCLWCGKKDFRNDIRWHGVFVPDRAAQWDNNETIRFVDLHQGYSRCDAQICFCPQGRDHVRNKWKLSICIGCGASAVHTKCAGDTLMHGKYTCSSCAIVLNISAASDETQTSTAGLIQSMFMSKSYGEHDFLSEHSFSKQTASVPSSKSSDDTVTSSNAANKQKYYHKDMFIMDKKFEIVGTATLAVADPTQQIVERCHQSDDVVGFSYADNVIQDICAGITAEGRELSLDMVDEVMDRLAQHMIFNTEG